ncbi:ABC transporter permease subunit [Auraticoccus sp. F435]|uniref:ABC transporter permease subunit n=1 Tax=Auraticoccus cholistanensis TaxID=2656650 RepID=A0A6A9V0F3_9ACTN|nr:carbohydrate ABC transporter permease [Auraticoccus cholistanensis]MVA75489.1 ABC transporter permease subunit [Auraticoccus cholistanensis]
MALLTRPGPLPVTAPTDPPPERTAGRTSTVRRVLLHLLLIAVCALTAYPLLWMLRSSLVPTEEIFSSPSVVPTTVDWANYPAGWEANPPGMGRFLLNSLVVCLGAVVGNLVACTLTAYAFARLRFPLRRLWFALMLATVMLPAHATLIPQYSLFTALGWVNTYLPLIVPKFLATDAFFIFLLVQFMRSIPRELDEAAEIDGCGHVGIFTRIILPLTTPALATTAVFTFIWTYEDFMGPLIYLSDLNSYTVPLGLRMFVNSMGESSYGQLFAMSVLSLVPVFVVFVLFQRRLIAGIATTGLKG